MAGVTDVLVNGHELVWLQRGARGLEITPSPFESEFELAELAQELVASGGRHLDQANPFADVSISDTFRVHACLASACHPKTLLSVRVHLDRHYGLAELKAAGMFGELELDLLVSIVQNRENFLIAGAAGSGKTTLLRAMLSQAAGDRVIAVEDVSELGLNGGNFISLQTRQPNIEGAGEIGLERLAREALRMRPDRLAIGEIRGAELSVLVQAFNTGHTGGGATIHANNFESVSERIAAIGWLCGLPGAELLAQAKTAIQWLIFVSSDGELRKVQRIGRWR